MTTSKRLEKEVHRHGWFGYAISNRQRTENLLRIARLLLVALVVTALVLCSAVVALALFSPVAAMGIFGGSALVTGGTFARRRWHRK